MAEKQYVCDETTITSPEAQAGLLLADHSCSWKLLFNKCQF